MTGIIGRSRKLLKYLLVLLLLLTAVPTLAAPQDVSLVLAADASDSVRFGAGDLQKALEGIGIHAGIGRIKDPSSGMRIIACNSGTFTQVDWPLARMGVHVPKKAESFAIARHGSDIFVVGRDSTGTMYGLLELAERVGMDGLKALEIGKPIIQSPFLEFRAVNPFLTLPMPTDKEWWFHSEDFWNGYLDMLARSRINWLDLHGMYDIVSTHFINMLPYFTSSQRFGYVGVGPEEAKKNVEMLRKVIRMAHARGIKVGLMNYHATWTIPSNPNPPQPQTERYLAEYTSEAVAQLLSKLPELDMFGFRIGESGMKEDFYRVSYLKGIAESGTHPELFTRSWGASREKITDIANENDSPVYLEIKYNGEQYGEPYQVAGGRMSGWRDYSYQDFLSYPRPYKVIWQVRTNGTHRAFRWGNPEWVARTVRSATLGDAAGISVEPLNTYYPMTDFMHKHGVKHDKIHWGYERDWFFYELWGRLAYNPDLSEQIWLAEFKHHFGDAGEHLYRATVDSSKIVDLGYTFYALSPDHRQHAPDLETGGDLNAWLKGQPFDTQVAQSIKEYVDNALAGKPSGKASPLQGAEMIQQAADNSLRELAAIDGQLSDEGQCMAEDVRALAALGHYYASKLRAATELGFLKATGDKEHGKFAMEQASKASAAWHELAEVTGRHYQPFIENLRMNMRFHWKKEEGLLAKDFTIISKAMAKAKDQRDASPSAVDSDPQITLEDSRLSVIGPGLKRMTVTADSQADSAILWHKPLPSETQWTPVPMRRTATRFTGSFDVQDSGAMYYIEALSSDGGSQYPDFRKETPYLVVEPWDSAIRISEQQTVNSEQ